MYVKRLELITAMDLSSESSISIFIMGRAFIRVLTH